MLLAVGEHFGYSFFIRSSLQGCFFDCEQQMYLINSRPVGLLFFMVFFKEIAVASFTFP